MNEEAFGFEICYTTLIAKFYVDYYDYQQQNITYLKNQINNLIHMSNEEISNLAEELNKNDEEVQEKYDQDLINENEFTRFFYRIYPRFVGRRRIRKTGFRLAAGTSCEH